MIGIIKKELQLTGMPGRPGKPATPVGPCKRSYQKKIYTSELYSIHKRKIEH